MGIKETIPAGTIVGEFEVVKPIENTEHFECAAWYRNNESETGRFPLAIAYPKEKPPHLVAELPGVVTGSNFTSRLGAHHGPPKVDEDKGEPTTLTVKFAISDAFTNSTIRLFEEFVEPIANNVIERLNGEIAEHVEYMAKRVPAFGSTVEWMTGEPSTGEYTEWATDSFRTYGTWIAEKAEILRRVYSPDATDRFKSIDPVIAKWKTRFEERPAKWDENRAFRERCPSVA